MLVRKFFQIKYFKKIEIIWYVLFIISLIPGGYSILDTYTIQEGIIISPEVEVFSSPSSYSTKLFNVHEGLKINIQDQSDNWLEIELIDGKIGWIESSEIRLLKTR